MWRSRDAALDVVDEVLLAIPRSFPHKQFEGATLDQRICDAGAHRCRNDPIFRRVSRTAAFLSRLRERPASSIQARRSTCCAGEMPRSAS